MGWDGTTVGRGGTAIGRDGVGCMVMALARDGRHGPFVMVTHIASDCACVLLMYADARSGRDAGTVWLVHGVNDMVRSLGGMAAIVLFDFC